MDGTAFTTLLHREGIRLTWTKHSSLTDSNSITGGASVCQTGEPSSHVSSVCVTESSILVSPFVLRSSRGAVSKPVSPGF